MKYPERTLLILGAVLGVLIGPLPPLRALAVLAVAGLFALVGFAAGMYEGDK